MDKSWINMHRNSVEYINGIKSFLEFAFGNAGHSDMIVCPCNVCKVGRNHWYTKDKIEHHLMFNRFWPNYKESVHHGELNCECNNSLHHNASHSENNVQARGLGKIDTTGLFRDMFGTMYDDNIGNEFGDGMEYDDDPISGEARNEHCARLIDEDVGYQRLAEHVEKEMFPGSDVSRLSFLLRLFHLKSLHGWSIKSFDMLLELLVTVFPQINPFQTSWSKCKQLTKDLGLKYEKIHACPNDCILYWDRREHHDECDKCYTSQWKDIDREIPMKGNALKIVQPKVNSSEVVFSESTMKAEAFAYLKLMGAEKYGRVRGYGIGVYFKDIIGLDGQTESDMLTFLFQKIQGMQNQIDDLSSRKVPNEMIGM